jgi:hypothetical protein
VLRPLLQQSIGNRAVARLVQAKLQNELIQRQAEPAEPSVRDVPIFLERLECAQSRGTLRICTAFLTE